MRIKIKAPRPKSTQKHWPAAYRWAAMGTLVAYSALGSKSFNVARAQDVSGGGPVNGPGAQTQGAQPVRRFEIAAGPLDSVLANFERVTGIKPAVSQEGIRSVSSPGVTGLYTPEQALQKLLADTGVVYRFIAADAVSLELKTVDVSVDVVTSVDALLTSTSKFTEPLLDTPQTIDVVSQKTMQEQGVTTLRDGLRNVAGISMAAGEGGSQGDSLTIRGFSARNDLYIDGMRDFGSYYRDRCHLGGDRSDSRTRVQQLRSRVDGRCGESGHEVSQHESNVLGDIRCWNGWHAAADYRLQRALYGAGHAVRIPPQSDGR